MPGVSVHFFVDDEDVLHELDRLAAGPSPVVEDFESVLLGSFVATEIHVHVITGKLKASGAPDSSFDGATWRGTISYARYPGIFELARGNMPTANHPEGSHFFFEPPEGSDTYRKAYEDVFYSWLGATGHGGPG
jgi:hypothetical protein